MSHATPPSSAPFWWRFGLIVVVLAIAIAAGHDRVRAVQLFALALPALIWLSWPLQSTTWRTARAVFAVLWCALFILDGAVRFFLSATYQATPDSSLVMTAVANTHATESVEYLRMYVRPLLTSLITALLALGLTGWAAWTLRRHDSPGLPAERGRQWVVASLCVALLVGLAGYVSKPWRRWHPALFWPRWTVSVDALRESWRNQAGWREQMLERARAVKPVCRDPAPATVVLVLGESVNRDNMGLYGYARDTTPALAAMEREMGSTLQIIREAWSTEAGTQLALGRLFQFSDSEQQDPQHLIAMARAAGYETWWITNHNDLAIEQVHGRFADELRVLNRIPGRSTTQLDAAALPQLEEALADPTPRKLIVLHLLGAHPHYQHRYPADWHQFGQVEDEVTREMQREDRPWWLQRKRAEYDAAIRYHDWVVAKTLDMTRAHITAPEYGAWLYLSDHGQEVGHDQNHAGHSASTAAGYKIPALIWQSTPRSPMPEAQIESRPFRADWGAWLLAHLLDIRWQGYHPNRDLLAVDYQWSAPALPVRTQSH